MYGVNLHMSDICLNCSTGSHGKRSCLKIRSSVPDTLDLCNEKKEDVFLTACNK
jgi:hypothetical protein